MGKSRYLSLGVLGLMGALSAPAHAQYTVSFWNYDAGGTYSTLTLAEHSTISSLGAPNATFTYNGPIDWVNNDPQGSPNLVSQFLNMADVSGLTGYGGDLTTFGNVSLSQPGDNCPTCTSFFEITGSITGSGGSVSHDDGASLYLDGNLGSPVVNSPGETTDIPNTFTMSPGTHAFELDYVEGNGSPSDLILSTTAVPEPATWAMMLTGFAGLGFAAFRRPRKTSVAIV